MDSDTYVELGDISGQERLIVLTTEHATSSYGQPVLLIDGKLVEQTSGFIVAVSAFKASQVDHPLVQRYLHSRQAEETP